MKLANITSAYRSKLIDKAYGNWLSGKCSVLDIGCGTGIVLNEINKTKHFKRYVGCDIEKYLLVNIPFKKMSTKSKLPFKKNEFDVAMFNDVLHHTSYKNQEKLLKEATRVAKCTLIFELKPTLVGKVGDNFLNKIHNPKMNIPYTYRSQEDWENMFKKLGIKFKPRNVESPFWYPFTHMAFNLKTK